MSNEKNRYSMKFIPVLLFLLLVGLLVVICGFLLVNLIHNDNLGIKELPGALAFVEIFELFLAILIVQRFKITLTRESIKGYSFFGFARQTTWDRIDSVKPSSFLFLKQLLVYTNDGKSSLWLPLVLKNGDDFKKKIVEFAPEGNPLRDFFESVKHP